MPSNAWVIAMELASFGSVVRGMETEKGKPMNLVAGIPILASLVVLQLPAAAQEKTPPELQTEAKEGRGCLNLRMPGIAEPSDRYNAYVLEHCPARSSTPVEASPVIRNVGMIYQKFLKNHEE